ncbi:MAG: twin-arginine translocation signal domain-containing protein, partial [Bacteroidales bacterium]|nr:twin-arginine translocation signal domain-containing protein [Bacteroidales bacterium]
MSDSRRSFIKKTGAAIAAFTILPRNVFGALGGNKKYVAPSDQLTRGIIGVGGIGMSGLHFVSDDKCRLVAVCDV